MQLQRMECGWSVSEGRQCSSALISMNILSIILNMENKGRDYFPPTNSGILLRHKRDLCGPEII